jgi:hypothetical protein
MNEGCKQGRKGNQSATEEVEEGSGTLPREPTNSTV